ncbi:MULTISPECIES: Hsp20/alpha crystallin family protein [Maribacter]|jgi:HSP20 family protein|uniref:Hsp20/alpha crystallin family protein n=1 Tax=Maribacter TaxID=252356 RepID=UPI00047EBD88|nr:MULTISPECIES: Hsp20/alpha crystallin family protein [Maribacter]|tara:strand:+ start:4016 stop:4441 length:426 start_codon:yes stop_codon:yes gene_type:complete
MSLTKRNEVLFPALMNELFRPDWFGGTENKRATVPAVNIKENEKDFELELFVPGRVKDDFKIEIDDSVLTISAEIKEENEEVKENFTRREFSISSFKRSFTLPDTVATDNIEATYEGGILKFNIPKKEEALPKPKRLIELK